MDLKSVDSPGSARSYPTGDSSNIDDIPAAAENEKWVYAERHLCEPLLGFKNIDLLDERTGHPTATIPVAVSPNSVVVYALFSVFRDAKDAETRMELRLSQCGKIEAVHSRVMPISSGTQQIRVWISFSEKQEAQRALAFPADLRALPCPKDHPPHERAKPCLEFGVYEATFGQDDWVRVRQTDLGRYRQLALEAIERSKIARDFGGRAGYKLVSHNLPKSLAPHFRAMDRYKTSAPKVTSPFDWTRLSKLPSESNTPGSPFDCKILPSKPVLLELSGRRWTSPLTSIWDGIDKNDESAMFNAAEAATQLPVPDTSSTAVPPHQRGNTRYKPRESFPKTDEELNPYFRNTLKLKTSELDAKTSGFDRVVAQFTAEQWEGMGLDDGPLTDPTILDNPLIVLGLEREKMVAQWHRDHPGSTEAPNFGVGYVYEGKDDEASGNKDGRNKGKGKLDIDSLANNDVFDCFEPLEFDRPPPTGPKAPPLRVRVDEPETDVADDLRFDRLSTEDSHAQE